MASISSLMGSSSSGSVYSNPNAIAGLASGMDTEAMIESAVSGIKTKLENLMKDRTKLEWEQSAYRSIIDKLSSFSDKYFSLGSNTSLLYSSFFTGSTTITPINRKKRSCDRSFASFFMHLRQNRPSCGSAEVPPRWRQWHRYS